MVIKILCDKSKYSFFKDYIESIMNKNKLFKICFNTKNIDKNDVIIYLRYTDEKNLTNSNIKRWFLNTEQLTGHQHLNLIKNCDKDFNVIDYSQSNIIISKKYLNNVFYLPYQVNYKEIFNHKKIYDIGLTETNSDKRLKIYNDIVKNLHKKPICINKFGKERDKTLLKCKIFVNIHRYDAYNIFEEIRCNRLIFNKIIVITEKSENSNLFKFKDYIIECNYNEIVDKVKYVLNNYKQVYNKLFSKFDIKKIDNDLKSHIDKIIRYMNIKKVNVKKHKVKKVNVRKVNVRKISVRKVNVRKVSVRKINVRKLKSKKVIMKKVKSKKVNVKK